MYKFSFLESWWLKAVDSTFFLFGNYFCLCTSPLIFPPFIPLSRRQHTLMVSVLVIKKVCSSFLCRVHVVSAHIWQKCLSTMNGFSFCRDIWCFMHSPLQLTCCKGLSEYVWELSNCPNWTAVYLIKQERSPWEGQKERHSPAYLYFLALFFFILTKTRDLSWLHDLTLKLS